MRTKFQFGKKEKVPEIDGGDVLHKCVNVVNATAPYT